MMKMMMWWCDDADYNDVDDDNEDDNEDGNGDEDGDSDDDLNKVTHRVTRLLLIKVRSCNIIHE